jgi:phenylacetate-CoA ligase
VDRLRIRVGHEPVAANRLDGLRDEIAAAVASAVGLEADVELVANEVLLHLGPPHKIPRVARW